MLSLRLATLTNLITRNMSGQMNALQPLLAHSLLIETTFFCGLFGAALGWLQTRNEAHRDLWAFLIHRPITRTGIFWGKTVAGLGLYLFGAGLPLVVLVAVVRTPGHVAAPFEWAMLGPVVSISLTGGAYFFAGVLTGLRQARWYGSRGLGLGLAIAGSASVFAAMEFWQSLALIALVVLILATAVWGSYQSGGFYRGQAVTGRLALIAAMTAGCGAVPLCLDAGDAARQRRAHPTGVDHRQGNRRQRRGGDMISRIHENVKEGGTLTEPLKASRIFPAMIGGMVDVGEQTGALPDMLLKIADTSDEEVDNSVTAMTSLLEPVMIVFLAVVVGSIVIAMFWPLIIIMEDPGLGGGGGN